MKIAMGVLAFLALFAGLIQVPGRRRRRSPSSSTRSSPTRRWPRSTLGSAPPGPAWRSARAISLVGIGIAYWLYIARPETPAPLIRRLRPLHTFLANKWYFDELIDILVVRPALAVGRFANSVFERFVVDGLVTRHRGDRARRRRRRPRRPERLRPQLRAAS